MIDRRLLLVLSGATLLTPLGPLGYSQDRKRPKFTMDLCPGRLGVKLNQRESIVAAGKYGFSSVEPLVELSQVGESELSELRSLLSSQRIVWGAAGVPVQFRESESTFHEDLQKLPPIAAGWQRAGVSRTGTWLPPTHGELTYLANFKRHASRLRQVAQILGDHGLSFGLEYVGPKTSWSKLKYPFIHSLAETKELIAEIGNENVGIILDSWHWYTARETKSDLLSLKAREVIAVDLNDAPSGIAVEEQIDSRRMLPMATGVIDLQSFMEGLIEIGFDGPIRAEPFNEELRRMHPQDALAATAAAMKKSFDSVG